MKFRAAVMHGPGDSGLRVEEVGCRALGPRDVLVRIRASGLCHTDLEMLQGDLAYPVPIVLGHEGAGIVEEVGAEVARVRPGDHVVCSWNPHCGHCFHCDRDQPILCDLAGTRHGEGQLITGGSRYFIDSQPVHHFAGVSSHAEYAVVAEDSAVRIPPEMPLDRACLIGCGVMTGVGAVSRVAQVEAGSTVVVVGVGAVGLNAVQGAALERAGAIIAIDRDEAKLALAGELGATHRLMADQQDIIDVVRSVTAGRGADYVFECAGQEASIQLSLEAARRGGSIVLLGKTPVNRRIGLRFGSLMGEKRIVRSSYGGARPWRDFSWLASLYLSGVLKLDPLITQRLTLDTIGDGFEAMRTGATIRSIIEYP